MAFAMFAHAAEAPPDIRLQVLAARTHAKVATRHDPRDIAKLPQLPSCLIESVRSQPQTDILAQHALVDRLQLPASGHVAERGKLHQRTGSIAQQ